MARMGQDLLNNMEVLHPELQNQVGEADVAKSLLALNMAQDYMESILAQQPDLLGDQTGTVVTANQTEKTTFPSGVLRLDGIQFLDATTSRPVFTLKDLRGTGAHVVQNAFPPLSLFTPSSVGGVPVSYYTDGSFIYWAPLPDGVYTMRWYGFQAQPDLTASGAYTYTDITLLPMAVMAVRIIRTGLDDDVTNYLKLAQEVFEPVVNVLNNFKREQAPGYLYTRTHST